MALPPELGNLSSLERLDVTGNPLCDRFPGMPTSTSDVIATRSLLQRIIDPDAFVAAPPAMFSVAVNTSRTESVASAAAAAASSAGRTVRGAGHRRQLSADARLVSAPQPATTASTAIASTQQRNAAKPRTQPLPGALQDSAASYVFMDAQSHDAQGPGIDSQRPKTATAAAVRGAATAPASRRTSVSGDMSAILSISMSSVGSGTSSYVKQAQRRLSLDPSSIAVAAAAATASASLSARSAATATGPSTRGGPMRASHTAVGQLSPPAATHLATSASETSSPGADPSRSLSASLLSFQSLEARLQPQQQQQQKQLPRKVTAVLEGRPGIHVTDTRDTGAGTVASSLPRSRSAFDLRGAAVRPLATGLVAPSIVAPRTSAVAATATVSPADWQAFVSQQQQQQQQQLQQQRLEASAGPLGAGALVPADGDDLMLTRLCAV